MRSWGRGGGRRGRPGRPNDALAPGPAGGGAPHLLRPRVVEDAETRRVVVRDGAADGRGLVGGDLQGRPRVLEPLRAQHAVRVGLQDVAVAGVRHRVRQVAGGRQLDRARGLARGGGHVCGVRGVGGRGTDERNGGGGARGALGGRMGREGQRSGAQVPAAAADRPGGRWARQSGSVRATSPFARAPGCGGGSHQCRRAHSGRFWAGCGPLGARWPRVRGAEASHAAWAGRGAVRASLCAGAGAAAGAGHGASGTGNRRRTGSWPPAAPGGRRGRARAEGWAGGAAVGAGGRARDSGVARRGGEAGRRGGRVAPGPGGCGAPPARQARARPPLLAPAGVQGPLPYPLPAGGRGSPAAATCEPRGPAVAPFFAVNAGRGVFRPAPPPARSEVDRPHCLLGHADAHQAPRREPVARRGAHAAAAGGHLGLCSAPWGSFSRPKAFPIAGTARAARPRRRAAPRGIAARPRCAAPRLQAASAAAARARPADGAPRAPRGDVGQRTARAPRPRGRRQRGLPARRRGARGAARGGRRGGRRAHGGRDG
jgi:hypothetical protein